MFAIDQHTANQIAKTQHLIYPITKKLFQASNDEEADEIEMRILKQTQEKGLTKRAALSLLLVLPLLLENKAITNYLKQTKNPGLRMMMPEILTIEEATGLANKEKNYSLTKEELESLKKVLKLFLNTSDI